MAGKKESFVMMNDWYDLIEDLDFEQRGELLTAIYEFEIGQNVEATKYDPTIRPILKFILKQLDKNDKKYRDKVERLTEIGRKGGKANAKHNEANAKHMLENAKHNEANAKHMLENAKHNVNVNVNENVNENVNVNETENENGNGNVNENVNVNVNDIDNSSERLKSSSLVESLPLNDGTQWTPTEAQYNEYVRLYPAVNVIDQFRAMRGWLIGNPKKRKTARGISRFVTSWLSREQDKPHLQSRPKNGTMTEQEYLDYWEGL